MQTHRCAAAPSFLLLVLMSNQQCIALSLPLAPAGQLLFVDASGTLLMVYRDDGSGGVDRCAPAQPASARFDWLEHVPAGASASRLTLHITQPLLALCA